MKKINMIAVLVLVMGLFASQALAWGPCGPCGGPGNGPGGRGSGFAPQPPSQEQIAAMNNLFDATKVQRIKLFADNAEMRALMRQDNPDPKQVRALAESIATTQEEIRTKAKELGVPVPPMGFGFNGFGPGGPGKRGLGGPGKRGPGAPDCPRW